ncbi:hypothetical protein ACLB2K_074332 [Fragaria x ananassa]
MVKEMRSEYSSSNPFSSPSSFHRHYHVFVKFAVSLLLVGSAFRLFFSDSIRYISVLEPLPPPVETEQELKETETPVSSFLAQTPSSLPPIDFPATNITQESENVIWTPFLVEAAIFEDMNGVSTSEIQLYLDKLDKTWTDQYNNLDYVVIYGGKWFLKTIIYHENNTVSGCHNCPGKNLTEVGLEHAYRNVLRLVFNFIKGSDHKASVFFRTTTPDHFENGEWFSGGYCNRTVPFKEGEVDMRDVDTMMRNIELEEFKKASANGPEEGARLTFLDTTHLSLLRPDGHPGPYRQFQPFAEDQNAKVQTDCLHWCLPGLWTPGMI